MTALRSLDIYPELLIPRFNFTFSDDTFRFQIPKTDIDESQPLTTIPSGLKQRSLPQNLRRGILACEIETTMGSVNISEDNDSCIANIYFSQGVMPGYDVVDSHIKDWVSARNKSRMPYLEGYHKLMQKVIELSELQYKFGVPADRFDDTTPIAPARFSLNYDYNYFEPVTIVTPEFQKTLLENSGTTVAKDMSVTARNYVTNLDKAVKNSSVNHIYVGLYGIYSDGSDFTYGQRGLTIEDEEYDDMPSRYRLQTGDMYVASTHNSGITYEALFAMLAVGMINRVALNKVAPDLIR